MARIDTLETLAQEVRDAYAAHDADPTVDTWTRLSAAIRAKCAAVNPHELEDLR